MTHWGQAVTIHHVVELGKEIILAMQTELVYVGTDEEVTIKIDPAKEGK